MKTKHRHTKIIFTIGPACEDEAILEALIQGGVDCCRINMAHASHEWTRSVIHKVNAVSARIGRTINIMMDIKGPEVRTGDVQGVWELIVGEKLYLATSPKALQSLPTGARGVTVNYPDIAQDVAVGATVLVDSGLIHLKVINKSIDYLECEVIIGGKLTSRRHLNLPGVYVNLPALTEKDKADIAVGIEGKVSCFALSFVRTAADVETLRMYLTAHGSSAHIISKLEDQSGVKHLEAIIDVSDGLMIARGDLGVECPFEQIPGIQRTAIELCIEKRTPVIVATHMLESMIHAPVPTRAEVTDIANAVYEQADCIMLSGETSQGKYPLACVQAMQRIIDQVEQDIELGYNCQAELETSRDKLLRSAVDFAQQLDDAAILVFTRTGATAQTIASMRAVNCPVFAFTDKLAVFEQLRLVWGIEPCLFEFGQNDSESLEHALKLLKANSSIKAGMTIVAVSLIMDAAGNPVETIQLRTIS